MLLLGAPRSCIQHRIHRNKHWDLGSGGSDHRYRVLCNQGQPLLRKMVDSSKPLPTPLHGRTNTTPDRIVTVLIPSPTVKVLRNGADHPSLIPGQQNKSSSARALSLPLSAPMRLLLSASLPCPPPKPSSTNAMPRSRATHLGLMQLLCSAPYNHPEYEPTRAALQIQHP